MLGQSAKTERCYPDYERIITRLKALIQASDNLFHALNAYAAVVGFRSDKAVTLPQMLGQLYLDRIKYESDLADAIAAQEAVGE